MNKCPNDCMSRKEVERLVLVGQQIILEKNAIEDKYTELIKITDVFYTNSALNSKQYEQLKDAIEKYKIIKGIDK